jgi:hypothetical protein
VESVSPPETPGDYDYNGTVEQQDYAVWRANYGKSVPQGSGADGNADGVVNSSDYVFWRKRLGSAGAAAAAIVTDWHVSEPVAVPMEAIAVTVAREERDAAFAAQVVSHQLATTPGYFSDCAGAKFRFAIDDVGSSGELLIASVLDYRSLPGIPAASSVVDEAMGEIFPMDTECREDAVSLLSEDALAILLDVEN